MNKLVSKNPVQRFKEGRKIVKGENGIGRWFYNGKEVFSDDGGRTFKLNSSGTLVGSPNTIKNLVKADKVGRTGYKVGNTWYQIGTGKKATSFTSLTQPKKEYIPLGQVSATREKYLGNNSTKVTSSKPTLVDNIFISGYQTNDDITQAGGVRAMQQKLKDAGFDIGKFGVDGKWGNDTQKAYNAWKQLQNKVKFTVPNYNDIPSFVPQTTETSQAVTPTQEEIMLSNVSTPTLEDYNATRTLNLNKAQTRNWINQNYGNAYSITGGARAAVRRILGGLGTTEDKDLILQNPELYKVLQKQGYWRFKQGGQLPSRNIIERFKQRNFR